MRTEARYALQGELTYATRDGDQRVAEFVLMNAPAGKHARHVARLRQAFVRAVSDTEQSSAEASQEAPVESGDSAEADAPEITGMDVVNLLARSSVDLEAVYASARELFTVKGVLKVDGEIQMTPHLIDKMAAADYEALVGSYIANFTIPS